MAGLEPALSPEAVLGALGQAAARPDGRHRIAAAVTGKPGLLTGQGARAPVPGVLRFIGALARAGAVAVVDPPCPRCGRQRPLGVPVDGLRLCAGCRSKARAVLCGRCGKVRPPGRLNDGGQPICQNCWHRDPRSWKPCAKCRNPRRTVARPRERNRHARISRSKNPSSRPRDHQNPQHRLTHSHLRWCRRGHRGRAGLPELPPGSRSALQHLRVGRWRPDRHLAGNRHPGMRAVPQTLDHLLALRHRGAAEGRHAARAAVRALPQPRPGLLETLRVLPGDLAAVDRGAPAVPWTGKSSSSSPRLAGPPRRNWTGYARPWSASTVPTSCWTG
jgi:hypothetical protein